MVQILRIVISGCIAINVLTPVWAEFRLDCDKNAQVDFVEGVDHPYCNCDWTGVIPSTIDWTFVHDTGQWELLARCHVGDKCTTSYSPSDLEVNGYESYSSLVFLNLTSRFSGVVTCQETSSNFNDSASYRMTVKRVSIDGCKGGISIPEGRRTTDVVCDFSPYTPNTVTWTIKMLSGLLLPLGNCRSVDNYNCTSQFSPNVTLMAGSTNSRIHFPNAFFPREVVAVICSVTFSDSTETDSCALDYYHQATVENCSIDTSRHNWSLIMSCDVTAIFTSEGRYEARIYEMFILLKNDQLVEMAGFAFDGYRSFRHYLQPYVNSRNNRQYYRGRAALSWPLSPYAGYYKNVAFETYHIGRSEVIFHPDGLTISLPTRPTLNCSDVTAPCLCSTETLGSPAGRLLWLIGNTTVAVGEYGVNQLLLPSDNQTDRQDVTVATCQLDWIQPFLVKKPAILRRTRANHITSPVLAGWTLFGFTVGICVTLLFILIRPRIIARWKDQNHDTAVLEEEER